MVARVGIVAVLAASASVARADRGGTTIGGELGIGGLEATGQPGDVAVALEIVAGRWLGSTVVVGGRASGRLGGFIAAGGLAGIAIGPTAELWIDDHLWVSGGADVALYSFLGNGAPVVLVGAGPDLRLGYAFGGTGGSALSLSLALSPVFFADGFVDPQNSERFDQAGSITTALVMVGYRYR